MTEEALLLVDNNVVSLSELADIVTSLGYQRIEQVDSADSAWRLMKLNRYRCVIAEMEMPEMSGLALLKIVRSDDRFGDIPFFLTHAAFTRVKVLQAGQEGASGLFVKPFHIENIRDKLAEMIQGAAKPLFEKEQLTLQRALNMMADQDYEKALMVLERLVEQGESAEIYYNIGYIKTAQEKYAEAIEAFQKATRLDRLFAKAYEAMGRAYEKLNRPQEAERFLQKAADIYLSKEKVEDAEEILNGILQIRPDTINVYNSLGVLYRKKGDFNKALQSYEKALKIHPRQPQIYYNIGRLWLDQKKPEKAKPYFQKALNLDSAFTEAAEVIQAIELGAF